MNDKSVILEFAYFIIMKQSYQNNKNDGFINKYFESMFSFFYFYPHIFFVAPGSVVLTSALCHRTLWSMHECRVLQKFSVTVLKKVYLKINQLQTVICTFSNRKIVKYP